MFTVKTITFIAVLLVSCTRLFGERLVALLRMCLEGIVG